MIGYKACHAAVNGKEILVVVELLIPDSSKKVQIKGKSYRTDEAVVLSFSPTINTNETISSVTSFHDCSFTYEIGKTVKPIEPFDDDPHNQFGSGIHFFTDKDATIDIGMLYLWNLIHR